MRQRERERTKRIKKAKFLQLNKGGSMLRWGFCVFALLAVAERWSDRSISEISCQFTERPCQRPLFPWLTVRE